MRYFYLVSLLLMPLFTFAKDVENLEYYSDDKNAFVVNFEQFELLTKKKTWEAWGAVISKNGQAREGYFRWASLHLQDESALLNTESRMKYQSEPKRLVFFDLTGEPVFLFEDLGVTLRLRGITRTTKPSIVDASRFAYNSLFPPASPVYLVLNDRHRWYGDNKENLNLEIVDAIDIDKVLEKYKLAQHAEPYFKPNPYQEMIIFPILKRSQSDALEENPALVLETYSLSLVVIRDTYQTHSPVRSEYFLVNGIEKQRIFPVDPPSLLLMYEETKNSRFFKVGNHFISLQESPNTRGTSDGLPLPYGLNWYPFGPDGGYNSIRLKRAQLSSTEASHVARLPIELVTPAEVPHGGECVKELSK